MTLGDELCIRRIVREELDRALHPERYQNLDVTIDSRDLMDKLNKRGMTLDDIR